MQKQRNVFWKHKHLEHFEIIDFVVFWKQKKQESIEIIELVVFWNDEKQEKYCNHKVSLLLQYTFRLRFVFKIDGNLLWSLPD